MRRYIDTMNRTHALFERLSALMQQAVREDAARHGLLPIQFQILGYLAQANRYSDIPIAVAEYFGITRGTVSQTLAVLEGKGLLRKEADPRHGNRVHLKLTKKGEALLEETWTQRLDKAMPGDLNARETLEQGLNTLLTTLQRLNDNQAFGVCHQCAHFLEEDGGWRCGLTGEPLDDRQRIRICREWRREAAPHG